MDEAPCWAIVCVAPAPPVWVHAAQTVAIAANPMARSS
jgi:hypothetical protein